MENIIYIEGKKIDATTNFAWDETDYKFEFILPTGKRYTSGWLHSLVSIPGLMYGCASSERAWVEYDTVNNRVIRVVQSEDWIEYYKRERLQAEQKRLHDEARAKSKKTMKTLMDSYLPNSTVHARRVHQKSKVELEEEELERAEAYFKKNNDFTFW